jgi:hypothetical protein
MTVIAIIGSRRFLTAISDDQTSNYLITYAILLI